MQTVRDEASNLVDVHHRALDDLDRVFRAALTAEASAPTPCAGWTITDLLAHELGQVVGFARALSSSGATRAADFRPRAARLSSWVEASTALRHAVDAAPAASEVALPELHPRLRFAASRVVAFRALDSTVHAWDLSRSLGLGYRPDEPLAAWVAQEAAGVPLDGRGPDHPFGPALRDQPQDAWHGALSRLGRDPHWTAS